MRKKLLLFVFTVLLVCNQNYSFAAFSFGIKAKTDSAVTNAPGAKSLQESMKEFNNLSRHEKKSRFKEIKKAVKEYTAQKKEGTEVSTNTLLLIIIAILLPPLAVYLHEGEINNKFWISVLLTLLGYLLFGIGGILFLGSLPGLIYALYIILSGT